MTATLLVSATLSLGGMPGALAQTDFGVSPSPGAAATAATVDGRYTLTFSMSRATWSTGDVIEGTTTLSVVSDASVPVGGSGMGLIATGYHEVGGSRVMDAGWTLDCRHYELDPEAPLVSGLTRSGGWDAGDPNKAFYQAFFRDPLIHLPVGTWDITTHATFIDGPGCSGASHSLTATIRIEVIDGPAGGAAPTPSSGPTASPSPQP